MLIEYVCPGGELIRIASHGIGMHIVSTYTSVLTNSHIFKTMPHLSFSALTASGNFKTDRHLSNAVSWGVRMHFRLCEKLWTLSRIISGCTTGRLQRIWNAWFACADLLRDITQIPVGDYYDCHSQWSKYDWLFVSVSSSAICTAIIFCVYLGILYLASWAQPRVVAETFKIIQCVITMQLVAQRSHRALLQTVT